jgi:RNA polymerase sigma-70 factor (ECF subfamily)
MTNTQAASLEGATMQTDAPAGTARVRDAFADLLSTHWNQLYRFAYHLTGNAGEAEELLQQAATEAFASFGRFQPGTRFDRWVMRILHNSFIDRIRRDRRRRFFSLDDVSGTLAADRSTQPEVAAERVLDGPVLRALNVLSPEFRTAVVLVDIEGLPYDEVAEILHCPVGTVRSRLHRGRLALREWLRPHMDALKRGER